MAARRRRKQYKARATGVKGELKARFGKDWQQAAYGDIKGYSPGMARSIRALVRQGPMEDPHQESMRQAQLAQLREIFGEVQARRKQLKVGKYGKKGGPTGRGGRNPGRPQV